MVAKIAVAAANFAIDKPYSYSIPSGMQLVPGMRVMVPFGKGNRRTEGVVLQVSGDRADGLKSVERCLDDAPVLDDIMLHLAAFLRERYFCTFFDAIRTMLPAGLWFQTKEVYSLAEDSGWQDAAIRVPYARELLVLLRDLGGQAEITALREIAGDEDAFERALQYLLKKKWVTTQTDFLRRTNDKTEKIATLAVSVEEAMEYAAGRPKSAAMQRAVLELLCGLGSAAVKELCYFTGAGPATIKRLEKLGYVTLSQRPVLRCREIRPVQLEGPLVLNEEQQRAYEGLSAQMHGDAPGVALLHGVTGSGKTSVYLKLIQDCLDAGRNAVLLVPPLPQIATILPLMSK